MKQYWAGIVCVCCMALLIPAALARTAEEAKLCAVIVASGPCGADNPEDLIWTLDENGVMTFIGSGAMADYRSYQPDGVDWATTAPWVDCQEIKSVVIPEGVTRIGAFAFDGTGQYAFPALASVTIPHSVTSVGKLAFAHCHALTQVLISDGVREIGPWAFHYCGGLSTLTIPASVTSIGESAFAECPGLTLTVSEDSYARRYALENRVRHKLTDGGGTVYVVGGPCGAGKPYDILWTLDENGNMAFTGSGAIADYPKTDETQQANTAPWLDYRAQIKSVTVSQGVTLIGAFAFYGWGDYTFSALSSLTIADSVTAIRRAAFDHCTALSRIEIPGSVKEIGVYAFCYINNLTEATLGEGVSRIDERAFEGCVNLSSLTIPASVKEIGYYALEKCPKLTLTVYQGSYAERYALLNSIRHEAIAPRIGDVTRDGETIRVEVTTPGALFVAAYGEGGKFLRAVTEVVSASGAAAVTLDTTGAASVRAFLFNGDTLKPLCDGKSIDL